MPNETRVAFIGLGNMGRVCMESRIMSHPISLSCDARVPFFPSYRNLICITAGENFSLSGLAENLADRLTNLVLGQPEN
jgi:hypothetical protein